MIDLIRFIKNAFILFIIVFIIAAAYLLAKDCATSCAACREEQQNQVEEAQGCACSTKVSVRNTQKDDYRRTYEIKNRESGEILVSSVEFSIATRKGEHVTVTKSVSTFLEARGRTTFVLTISDVNAKTSSTVSSFDDVKSIKIIRVNYIGLS